MKLKVLFMIVVCLGSMKVISQPNGFVHAYDSMHQVFSKYYPFTGWKAIDWNMADNLVRTQIVEAAATGDSAGFYIALKSYFDFAHDGHVGFRHGWEKVKADARYRQIGGSYGFALTRLDDGRDVARLVNNGSPAWVAGMRFGATILEVNDRAVADVLDTVKVLWAEMIPATLEFKKINQGRLIGRAPVGHPMRIKFLNRGSSSPVTAILTAYDDNYRTYDQTSMHPVEPELGVFSGILQPKGFGYIKMNNEGGDSTLLKQEYNDFKNALINFDQQGVKGVVLDFRVNSGGDDALAAAIAGFFHTDTVFYEYQTWYNADTDSIEIWPLPIAHFDPVTLKPVYRPNYAPGSLYSEPQTCYYNKPVVVMVNPRSISTGEGVPMILQKLHRAKVVSFYGSNGSFGMVERTHYFFPPPDDLKVTYPYGQSVDHDFRIQLDSDSAMNGGVIPDIRIPLNDTVIDQLYIDSIDVELNYAVGILNAMLGINPTPAMADAPALSQNNPNPFDGITSITYSLPTDAVISLEFCDLHGRTLMTLVSKMERAGTHTVTFNGSGFAPGLYFFRLQAGASAVTRKCTIK